MAARQPDPGSADVGDPIDRRVSDGAAGIGDMLGGLSVGAGGRLGPDHGVDQGGVTVPISGDAPGFEGQTIPMDGGAAANGDGSGDSA